MENKINEIKRKIEQLIEWTKENYKQSGWNNSHELRLARIDGLVESLEILTEKEFYYDDNGLHERKED